MDRVEKRKTTTILIVDDSELNRVMLAAMLGENYEILEASDGVEALSVIQKYETSIDLVLLDIVMPGMCRRCHCDDHSAGNQRNFVSCFYCEENEPSLAV